MILGALGFALLLLRIAPVGRSPVAVRELLGCEVEFGSVAAGWLRCPDELWVTSDSGRSWVKADLPAGHSAGVPLRGRLRTEKNGWIARNERIFETADGGRSWKEMGRVPLRDASQEVYWLDLSDDRRTAVAIVVEGERGAPKTVLVSRDGGRSWGKGVAMADAERAGVDGHSVLVVGQLTSRVSWDGGRTWAEQVLAVSPADREAFVNALDAPGSFCSRQGTRWLLYPEGYLFRWRTGEPGWRQVGGGGRIWTGTGELNPVQVMFADDRHGYLIGKDGKLRESSDGGERWAEVASPFSTVLAISCVSGRRCIVLGGDGRIGLLEE